MASSKQSTIANFFLLDEQPHLVPNSDSEFDEADLVYFDASWSCSKARVGPRRSAKVAASRSVAVSIPVWSARAQGGSEGEGEEDGLAPHEYLARKRGASLSVHEGAGRTLKGRDMSRVRNAIWKGMGFED